MVIMMTEISNDDDDENDNDFDSSTSSSLEIALWCKGYFDVEGSQAFNLDVSRFLGT